MALTPTRRPRGVTLMSVAAGCAIATLVLHASPGAGLSESLSHDLTRIFASPDLNAHGFGPARWLADAHGVYLTVEPSASNANWREVVRYDAASGAREVMISAKALTPPDATEPLAIENYEFSPDQSHVLIFTNSRKVWRQNTRGDFWVLDRPAAAAGKPALRKLGGDAPASMLMFAKFSPDGRRVAYVREHNLYVEDVASGAITPLTSDGSPTLINGTSDWVYEEELNLRDAFRWSPDSSRVAYWHFDSKGVGTFALINNTAGL